MFDNATYIVYSINGSDDRPFWGGLMALQVWHGYRFFFFCSSMWYFIALQG